jgi:hypothetical protein
MFRMHDGAEFLAADEADLVRQLHLSSRSPSPNDLKFMWDMADRAKLFTGAEIRCDTPKNFVDDLIAAGLLTELQIN